MIEVDILSDEELEENVFFKDTNKIWKNKIISFKFIYFYINFKNYIF